MRTALTIGQIAGSDVWEFIHGPDTDIPTQRAEIKRLRASREHPKYAEVQLWESGAGIIVRHRFRGHIQEAQEPAAPVDAPEPFPDEAAEAEFQIPPAKGKAAKRR